MRCVRLKTRDQGMLVVPATSVYLEYNNVSANIVWAKPELPVDTAVEDYPPLVVAYACSQGPYVLDIPLQEAQDRIDLALASTWPDKADDTYRFEWVTSGEEAQEDNDETRDSET